MKRVVGNIYFIICHGWNSEDPRSCVAYCVYSVDGRDCEGRAAIQVKFAY